MVDAACDEVEVDVGGEDLGAEGGGGEGVVGESVEDLRYGCRIALCTDVD